MKSSVFTIVAVISIFAVLVATAGASSPKSASLDNIRYIPGKGVVLLFSTSGTFSQADFLNAYIVVNHQVYSLHCNEQGSNKAVCEAPGKINQFHGMSATGAFAGFAFETKIPKSTHSHDDK